MGQCVSRKAGAVIAASSYRIMDKPAKNQDDSKGASKRGVPQTRGTAISFGFRRKSRGENNQHMSIQNYETEEIPQRSKSVGPEQVRRRLVDDDDHRNHQRVQSASSGRSTPRLAPPKKEAVGGIAVRTNRFGFRQPQAARYTDKVGDICTSAHSASHFNQERMQQQQQQQEASTTHHISRAPSRTIQQPSYATTQSGTKLRPSPVNNPPSGYHHNNNNNINNNNNNNNNAIENNRRIVSGIPEPVSKYTLHTSHLPLPQYAVRVNDSNSKIAKTAVNQSRKVSNASKGSASSQSGGSGTEDSGIGSQPGYSVDSETLRNMDYMDAGSPARRINVRPRNLRMVVSGKSFDVRDVDNDSTVTEISVIPLPKAFASVNLTTGLVRERTNQYQRITNKDNRYTESTTSMSTTSSEGYDEGLGEEKVYKDRSRSEKVASIKSDFSPPSSDDPEEYGHGEAMADEYSFSSSDECRATNNTGMEHLKSISNAVKSGSLPKSTLRSVLLTIEDPAFAAAAATNTTLIDDETSPVDSLVDSLTASITQSDGQQSKKELIIEKEVEDNNIGIGDDDSPGTPTNASNSLSLSEGREYFDDEIADQPGLTFDDGMRGGGTHDMHSGRASRAVTTDNSHTLIEAVSKTHLHPGKHVENSPINCRRISRTDSVGTLSPCESITSDDLMLDYERSETSSYDGSNRRLECSPAVRDDIDDATILSELEAHGEEVMREWSSLLNAHQQNANLNIANNNLNVNNNNNNSIGAESGIGGTRTTTRLLRSRPGTESPRSLDSVRTRQVASPFKPVLTGNGTSPSIDSGEEGSPRLERCNYHQDIVYIKTGLLKLMRIIQESEDKDLTRADTLNPFNNTTVNGLFHNLNDENPTDTNGSLMNGALNIADELTDLRRQVIFLQGQVEDKDRVIQNLQLQVAKQQELINSVDSQSCASSTYASSMSSSKDTSNAATQTEKIRPVSAGPSLLQSYPQDNGMGPLVSWSDQWNNQNLSPQRPPSLVELTTSSISTTTASSPSSKNQRKLTSDRLPRTLKPRPEALNRLNSNGLETDKLSTNNSVIRRPLKTRESSKIIDTNEFSKESLKSEIPKSSIPSLKKLTVSSVSRVTRTDVSITGRSHNS